MQTADPRLDPHLRRIITAILVGASAVVFDSTILSVAIPRLVTALDAGLDSIQWVVTAYLLAMFAVIPVTGWAQARWGAKRLWLVALAVFTLGSALCGLAWDLPSMITFRTVQGLGGGVVIPLMATILMQAAGGRSVGRLMAVVGLPMALGPILGPVVGGLVLHVADWPWLFWLNLPLGACGLVLAVRLLPHDPPTTRPRLDVVGLALATIGVVALVLGLSRVTGDGGFGHPDVLLPCAVGLSLCVTYVLHALRRGPDALIDVALLRHRPLAMATLVSFAAGMAMYGAMFVLPLFYQVLRGSDPLATGLLLVPQGVGALASRSLAGRLTDSIGARWVVVGGFAVMTAATVPFALADTSTSGWLLGTVLLARGVGLGAVFMPLMASAYVGLAHDEIPQASIVTRVAQQVGGSFGIALIAVLLQQQTAAASSAAEAADAFGTTFWCAVALMVVGLAAALLLPGREMVAAATAPHAVQDPPGTQGMAAIPVDARRNA